jgi:hypothetical protein
MKQTFILYRENIHFLPNKNLFVTEHSIPTHYYYTTIYVLLIYYYYINIILLLLYYYIIITDTDVKNSFCQLCFYIKSYYRKWHIINK